MKVLAGGARVFGPSDEVPVTEGSRTYRAPISKKNGAKLLAQTVSDYAPGRAPARVNPAAEEVLYVVAGRGACTVCGFSYPLDAGVGVYIPAGAVYQVESAEHLTVVSVCCPQDDQARVEPEPPPKASGSPPPRTVREQDRAPIPVADRSFKLMVDKDLGCRQVTQFVGFIPPSKAPFHYHTYEEAIYIVEGAGIIHTEGESAQIGAGASIYLPVGVRHCIENPGTEPIRLLGVFYPSGSPAAAYEK
ncbi:MAG TPA: cupin domain-containing protein [Terriglobia bacterium]|nr:cupin domain-containing protein [Terriglobia bacterium]